MGLGCWSFQTLFLKMFHRFSIVFFFLKLKVIYNDIYYICICVSHGLSNSEKCGQESRRGSRCQNLQRPSWMSFWAFLGGMTHLDVQLDDGDGAKRCIV